MKPRWSPSTPEEWQGLARMAAARQAAGYHLERYHGDEGKVLYRRSPGAELTDLDRGALPRHPGAT